MENQMYMVLGCYDLEGETELLFTDEEHLQKCAEEAFHLVHNKRMRDGKGYDADHVSIHYNKAHIGFGGYLVAGDYIGTIKIK